MAWEALLKQAGAQLAHARANEEASHAMHLQTQRMLCKESAVDMEPDRLEAWYIVAGDAESGTGIAKQIIQRVEIFC